MTKKPLILLASARKESNTKKFVKVVFANTEYELIDLLDFYISTYHYQGKYPDNDQFLQVINEIVNHKVIVFATPVYWYAMSDILKTFFDRLTDLATTQKHLGRKLRGKSVFLLAAGSDEKLPDGFEIPLQLTSLYFHMNYSGSIYCSEKDAVPANEFAGLITRFIGKLETSM